MIARGSFWLAVLTATGLHAGALALWSGATDGAGSGADGTTAVSVAAVDPALQAMVEAWDRPPDVADQPDQIVPPHVAVTADAPRTIDMAPASTPPPRLPAVALPLPAPDQRSTVASLIAPEPVPVPVMTRPAVPRQEQRADQRSLTTPSVEQPPLPETTPPVRAVTEAPRPDPRPTQPAVARQVARGDGGLSTAGTARANATSQSSASDRAAAQARWAADIQSRIARYQSYPRGARASGQVKVSMVILKTGRLNDVTISQSSGAARLDRAAMQAVRQAAPFPPAPDALTDAWYQVGQWISFERR